MLRSVAFFNPSLNSKHVIYQQKSVNLEVILVNTELKNTELKKAAKWFQANRLTLNVSKTKYTWNAKNKKTETSLAYLGGSRNIF